MKRTRKSISFSIKESVWEWTGKEPELTRAILKLIADSNFNSQRKPSAIVKEVIQCLTINSEETIEELAPLKKIQDRLLNNKNCEPFWLLKTYQQILELKEIPSDRSSAQAEILGLKLAIEEQGYLKRSNLIYQYFFDREWVQKQLKNRSPYQLTLSKLAAKADSPNKVLEEILNWTNKDFILTQKLCYLVCHNLKYIPADREKEKVEDIVNNYIIKNCSELIIASRLHQIKNGLLKQERDIYKPLKLYQKVLESTTVPANNSKEERELLDLGLLDVKASNLVVSNRIYREVFNLEWVKQQLEKIRSKTVKEIELDKENASKQSDRFIEKHKKKLSITILALVGLITIFKLPETILPIESKQTQKAEKTASATITIVKESLLKKKTRLNEVKNVPVGTFRYGGSTSWAAISAKINPIIADRFPDFKLLYTEHPTLPTGSGTGIDMLLDSQLSFAQSSRSLFSKEYQKAAKKYVKLQEIPIAIDAIVFTVNPDLNISGLTIAQIKDIYTGKITNWQEVGGPNLEIIAYSKSPSASGTADFFRENILNNEQLGKSIKKSENLTRTLRKVAREKGAIYYGSAAEIIGQCSVKPLPVGRTETTLIKPYNDPLIKPSQCPADRNTINYEVFHSSQYPLSRYLFVIVKKNGLFEQQAGMAYTKLLLTDEGQELIEQAGFLAIYK